MKKDTNITVCLTEDMKRKLQELSKKKKWTISSTVYNIIEEYLEKQN